jgi:excisionase family DNA binding protein
MEKLLTVADASHILGITPATVRLLVSQGKLKVAVWTERGQRLFKRSEVERLAAIRTERAKTHAQVGRALD